MPKSDFRESDHRRGQPGNRGQFAPKPSVQADTPQAPAVDLAGQYAADSKAKAVDSANGVLDVISFEDSKAPPVSLEQLVWVESVANNFIDQLVEKGYSRAEVKESVRVATYNAELLRHELKSNPDHKKHLLEIADGVIEGHMEGWDDFDDFRKRMELELADDLMGGSMEWHSYLEEFCNSHNYHMEELCQDGDGDWMRVVSAVRDGTPVNATELWKDFHAYWNREVKLDDVSVGMDENTKDRKEVSCRTFDTPEGLVVAVALGSMWETDGPGNIYTDLEDLVDNFEDSFYEGMAEAAAWAEHQRDHSARALG